MPSVLRKKFWFLSENYSKQLKAGYNMVYQTHYKCHTSNQTHKCRRIIHQSNFFISEKQTSSYKHQEKVNEKINFEITHWNSSCSSLYNNN